MDKKIISEKVKENFEKFKDDFNVRIALLLILGFLLGFVIKSEAVESMVIGFDDYRVDSYSQDYNFQEIQDEMNAKIEKMKAEEEMQAAMEE